MNARVLFVFTMVTLLSPLSAIGSDYGCRVLLCMANPAGPRAVAECAPTIDRLMDDLAHGRGFPSCNEANGGAGMNLGFSHYDPCPEGLSAAPAGEYVLAKGAKDFYRGIGEGDGIDCNRWSDDMCVLPAKVCVGPRVGQTSISISQGYEGDFWYEPATVYESVRLQSPRSNVLYVDVFINGELYRRARW